MITPKDLGWFPSIWEWFRVKLDVWFEWFVIFGSTFSAGRLFALPIRLGTFGHLLLLQAFWASLSTDYCRLKELRWINWQCPDVHDSNDLVRTEPIQTLCVFLQRWESTMAVVIGYRLQAEVWRESKQRKLDPWITELLLYRCVTNPSLNVYPCRGTPSDLLHSPCCS